MKKKQESTALEPVGNADQLTHTEVTTTQQSIQNCILTIRGQQVMLDRDLAALYGVENRALNQAVKRNIERFPENFMFQLSKDEFEDWKSQIVTSNSSLKSQFATSRLVLFSDNYVENDALKPQFVTSNAQWKSQFATSNSIIMGARKRPYAFTEQGVAMLSAVLRSETAVAISIRIIEAFVAMRRFLASNAQVFQRIEAIEHHQLRLTDSVEKHNQQFEEVFKRLDEKAAHPTQGIFYNGQIYDAHSFVCDLIKEAKERIVVVDNYLDNTVLTRLAYRQTSLPVTIFTQSASKQFNLDVEQHNAQYPGVTLRISNKAHDRFLIIDNKIYHLGASIKDLGKKIFAFSLMEEEADELLKRLE